MARKEEYKLKNQQFLEEVARQEGIVSHPSGLLYQIVRKGDGNRLPALNSIVSVHYRGTLANGREFDNSWKRGCPEALRVAEVIEGWRIALLLMHAGDCWKIYVPFQLGYGSRASGPIPAFSTLVFEIELLNIF